MRIAIYDLDRTITRRPTFTPFLVFAAKTLAPHRLLLLPVWIFAMIGYKLRLYSRTALKRFGMRLMTGRATPADLERVSANFAASTIAAGGLMPGTMRLLDEDRDAGARIVIATAAFEFYAKEFARELGIEHVIGTKWECREIPGGNCFGEYKRNRVKCWCETLGVDLSCAKVRFVSDSFADAPLLEQVDEPVFVTTSRRQAARAQLNGWEVRNPAR